jgi:small conductance mechanosensitive channel
MSDTIDVAEALEHVGVAVGILASGSTLAIVAKAICRRLLRRHEASLGRSVIRLVGRSIYAGLLVVTFGRALIALGVPPVVVGGIGFAILVVLAIALQESVADLAATVKILILRSFRQGELIETMGHDGDVHELLLFNTVRVDHDHRLVTLSNSKIHENGIVNHTRTGRIRAGFSRTLGHRVDLDRVRAVIIELASNDARVRRSPPIEVTAEDVLDGSIRVQVWPAVAPKNYWEVTSDLREQIKARFDTEGTRFAAASLDLALHQSGGPAT